MASLSNRRKRMTQFSVRAVLLLFAIVSVVLAVGANRAHQQDLAISRIRESLSSPYSVGFDYRLHVGSIELEVPEWVRSVLGDRLFRNVVYLRLENPTDAVLFELRKFPSLQQLVLKTYGEHSKSTLRDGLKILPMLTNVTRLEIEIAGLCDESMQAIGSMPQLEHLDAYIPNVTDLGIAALGQAQRLRWLEFDSDQVTDRGMESLGVLRNVVCLRACSPRLTDACIDPLRRIPTLDYCDVSSDQLTLEGLDRIQRLFPNKSGIMPGGS